MKDDEKKFFRLCYRYISHIRNHRVVYGTYTPRDLINILQEWFPYKRAWYYLKKWDRLNFYNCGVALDLGWIDDDKIPQAYLDLLEGEQHGLER